MSPVSLRSLQNLLGEDDDVLTVLSLLPKKNPDDAGAGVRAALSRLNEGVVEVPLYEAAAWLYLVAGEDGRVPHSLSLVRSPGGPAEFIANEDSPVKEVVERMYSIAHDNAEAPTRISIVTTDGDERDDDPRRRTVRTTATRLPASCTASWTGYAACSMSPARTGSPSRS